ncbi:MAG TPA: MarR family transcriptional regulator, partial [Micromonosporaceae bacterium]
QGMTATEEKALDLLDRYGPLTARELSRRSGLAPASVTGLIDRLERKGYARRVPNPADGRSVLVEPVLDRLSGLAPLFEGLTASWGELCERFTDEQLTTILEFLTESAARQRAATIALTEADEEPTTAEPALATGKKS